MSGGRLVGAPGFEPGTSCAQGKRATRLRHAPNRGHLSFCQACYPVSSAITTEFGASQSVREDALPELLTVVSQYYVIG